MRTHTGWLFAAVQLFFTLSWTVYVVFLPELAGRVGLASSVPTLLLADQLVFLATDLWVGRYADRARDVFVRGGRWLVAAVVSSSLAFVLVPHARGRALFLIVVFVWVTASAALRVPPAAFLSRFAGPRAGQRGAAAYAMGMGVAGALAPYVQISIRGKSPVLPFALSSAAVVIAALALVWALRAELDKAPKDDGDAPLDVPKTDAPARVATAAALPRADKRRLAVAVLGAAAAAALAFQVHFALRSAGIFIKLAGLPSLPNLMPVFWVGFSLSIYPVSRLVTARGALPTLIAATAFGAAGSLSVEFAPSLPTAVVGQLVTGAAWAATFVSAMSACSTLGHEGEEGRLLGRFFALLAAATFVRLAIVTAGVDKWPFVAGRLRLMAAVAWGVAALWLLLRARHEVLSRNSKGEAPAT